MDNYIEKIRCFFQDIARIILKMPTFYEKYEVQVNNETEIITGNKNIFPKGQNSTIFINQGDTDFLVNGIFMQAGTGYLTFSQVDIFAKDMTNYRLEITGTPGSNPQIVLLTNRVSLIPKTKEQSEKVFEINSKIIK